MADPKYTITEYRTDHGTISAVTLTAEPDRIVFGFTDRKACTEFLRKKRARNCILNGKILQLEPLPQHTDKYRRCKDWLEEFVQKNAKYLSDKNPIFSIEKKHEIDHCIITDTYSLRIMLVQSRPVIVLDHYSSFNGSRQTKRTDMDPKGFIEVVEFMMDHSEDILKNLRHE